MQILPSVLTGGHIQAISVRRSLKQFQALLPNLDLSELIDSVSQSELFSPTLPAYLRPYIEIILERLEELNPETPSHEDSIEYSILDAEQMLRAID